MSYHKNYESRNRGSNGYATSNSTYGNHTGVRQGTISKPPFERVQQTETKQRPPIPYSSNSITSHLNKQRNREREADLSQQNFNHAYSRSVQVHTEDYVRRGELAKQELIARRDESSKREESLKRQALEKQQAALNIYPSNEYDPSNYRGQNLAEPFDSRERNFGAAEFFNDSRNQMTNDGGHFYEGGAARKTANFANFSTTGTANVATPNSGLYVRDGVTIEEEKSRSPHEDRRHKSRSRSRNRSRSPTPSSPQSGEKPPSYEESVTRGTVGLENMGNTCYFSSAVQCISNTPQLRDVIIGAQYQIQNRCETKGAIVAGLRNVLKEIWCSPRHMSAIRPRELFKDIQKSNEQFEGKRQQDSQELLLFMLNALSEETNRVKTNAEREAGAGRGAAERKDSRALIRPKSVASLVQQTAEASWQKFLKQESSFVTDVIAGQLESSLECKVCGHQSRTYESFFQLSLPLPDNNYGVDLDECFKLMCEDEILDGDNSVLCERCRKNRPCKKSLRIESLPPVLIIQLNRFSIDFRNKIDIPVEAPMENMCLVEHMTTAHKESSMHHSNSTEKLDF
ncbi:ubiquitin carboxyl-terminal hydrolase Usp2-like isoform X2 [Symsagittifera roscoffensis]|uniref:ubiquitin carboxyl-terminal hydrolase Usp2-like isoform X2 n=1 Tax=Symsagittifera roscoffensis TaxID=84072 RepID=UPI00307B78FB